MLINGKKLIALKVETRVRRKGEEATVCQSKLQAAYNHIIQNQTGPNPK